MKLTGNAALAHKIKLIKEIQTRGLRVLTLQRGGVTVWDKRNPSLEWDYPDLATAHADILNLLGKS